MSELPGSRPDPLSHDPFEITVRGYSRGQVDDFITMTRRHIRELQEQLSQALGEAERLCAELAATKQAAARPKRLDLTERIGHILELADEEAEEQLSRATEEATSLRRRANEEADTLRDDARRTADQLLVSAREQADGAVANARAQAEATTRTARVEADRLTGETHRQAEATLTEATETARRVVAEATIRARAIDESTEGRLADLISGHADLMRHVARIRDVAAGLAARDAARGPLTDELAGIVAGALGTSPAIGPGGAGRSQQVGDHPAIPKATGPAAWDRRSAPRREELAAG